MKRRNDGKHEGILTERQWAEKGYRLNADATGEELWTNANHGQTAVYYSLQEVHQASEEELDTYWAPILEERKLARAYAREQKKRRLAAEAGQRRLEKAEAEERRRQEEEEMRKHIIHLEAAVSKARGLLRKYAAAQSVVEPSQVYDTIVLDTETTGLRFGEDEVLKLSILGGDGTVLYNGYFRPLWKDSWPAAEKVNNISPEMVKDAPVIYDELPVINGILKQATTVVAYNANFDLSFLEASGAIFADNLTVRDVMLEFAPIYGEIHPYYGVYKWQTLMTCADYYGYQWGDESTHDSLADARATLHCFQCINRKSRP